ncbi:hypothetical protein ACFL6C_10875 [Myxococcota bacterium]
MSGEGNANIPKGGGGIGYPSWSYLDQLGPTKEAGKKEIPNQGQQTVFEKKAGPSTMFGVPNTELQAFSLNNNGVNVRDNNKVARNELNLGQLGMGSKGMNTKLKMFVGVDLMQTQGVGGLDKAPAKPEDYDSFLSKKYGDAYTSLDEQGRRGFLKSVLMAFGFVATAAQGHIPKQGHLPKFGKRKMLARITDNAINLAKNPQYFGSQFVLPDVAHVKAMSYLNEGKPLPPALKAELSASIAKDLLFETRAAIDEAMAVFDQTGKDSDLAQCGRKLAAAGLKGEARDKAILELMTLWAYGRVSQYESQALKMKKHGGQSRQSARLDAVLLGNKTLVPINDPKVRIQAVAGEDIAVKQVIVPTEAHLGQVAAVHNLTVDELRDLNPGLLLNENGKVPAGTPVMVPALEDSGEAILDPLMNAMGAESALEAVAAIGYTDFNKGNDDFGKLLGNIDATVVPANNPLVSLDSSEPSWLEKWTMEVLGDGSSEERKQAQQVMEELEKLKQNSTAVAVQAFLLDLAINRYIVKVVEKRQAAVELEAQQGENRVHRGPKTGLI